MIAAMLVQGRHDAINFLTRHVRVVDGVRAGHVGERVGAGGGSFEHASMQVIGTESQ